MSTHPHAIKRPEHTTLIAAAVAVLATLALVIVAVIGYAIGHTNSHSTVISTPPAAAAAEKSASGSGRTVAPGHPVTPSHPATPSAATKTLQEQLGRLNYYEGPVDGIMGPQTVQSIKYLQRDAGLPQTGIMNAATAAALQNFLVHGNSQMGG
jgi:hypothetical protein